MLFKNRKHAGHLLALALQHYKNRIDTLIIGLPRGGVIVAYEVAKSLNLPIDIICPRKIGAPFNPELAIGAITETGEGIYDEGLVGYLEVSEDYIRKEEAAKKKVAQERLNTYRKGLDTRDFSHKTVILVDDGLATGATMKAAIQSVKGMDVSSIVVAVPVSPPDTAREVEEMVDEFISLYTPQGFSAVGEFYEEFDQTEDEEILTLFKTLDKKGKIRECPPA